MTSRDSSGMPFAPGSFPPIEFVSSPDSTTTRLLLVDDNEEFRSLLATLLPRLFAVNIVASMGTPAEALDYIRDHEVDMAIADLRMPGMNGIDFIAKSRSLKTGQKVILATFSPSPAVEEAAFAAGAAGVVSKSEMQEELAEFLPPFQTHSE